jgi:exodeoxyribonuclease III
MAFTLAHGISTRSACAPIWCSSFCARKRPISCACKNAKARWKDAIRSFAGIGYGHWVARGQKGYNGVAILSRLPLEMRAI